MHWYLEAARSGYVDSIWNLATMIMNGEGCKKNIELAKCLIEVAANSGCNSACLFLSDCYESNTNVYEKDLELSEKWRAAAWDFENESDFADSDILKSFLEEFEKPEQRGEETDQSRIN